MWCLGMEINDARMGELCGSVRRTKHMHASVAVQEARRVDMV